MMAALPNLRTGSTSKKIAQSLKKHLKNHAHFLQNEKRSFLDKWSQSIEVDYSIDDIIFEKFIGRGGFGLVALVKDTKVDGFVAVKLLEKRIIVKEQQLLHVTNELKILKCAKFTCLIEMKFFSKDNVYLYLGMEYINGGELFAYLRMNKRFNEAQTKFYGSQVVFAIEYLHFLGIVFRDLKPENLLLCEDGYVKLIDFGFGKKIDCKRTYTFCGTPDYLAPEIILNSGHGFEVDWWALGILFYEFSCGFTPFYSDNPMQQYEKIVEGKYSNPPYLTKNLKDFISHLLQVDRTHRYGCLKDGIADIKSHPLFDGFDWDAVLNKELQAPYIPPVADPYQNDPELENISIRTSDVDECSEEFAMFG